MSSKPAETFAITFLAYTSIHCIRTSYSFIKSELPDAANVDIQIIGIVDALMLMFLGLGHLLHAIFPIKKPVQSLVIGMSACGMLMGLLAFAFNFQIFSNIWVLGVLMCANGYMQSYTWPMLLMVVHAQFDPQKNGLLLGFWSTNANFGNIIGFVLSKLILSYGEHEWTLVIAISGLYAAIFGALIFIRFKELSIPDQQKEESLKTASKGEFTQTVSVFGHDSVTKATMERPQIKDPALILLTITFSLTKSVIYGILLWLPLYFKSSEELKDYAAEIPIAYDVAAIFGSVFLGHMFTKVSNKGFLLNPFMIILVICFMLLKYTHMGVAGYFVVIAVIGFSLGGTFNTLSGLIVMELVKLLPPALKSKRLGFYSALTMSVGNVMTALTQILIGFVVGKDDEKKIFLVFIIYAGVSLGCLLLLTFYTFLKKKQTTGNQDYENLND